jgi:hypothetical protein
VRNDFILSAQRAVPNKDPTSGIFAESKTMRKSIKIAPANSIFFLEDSGGGAYPEIDDRDQRIWSTDSCIIIGSLCFMDGETELTISDEDVPPGTPVFEGMLATPSKVLQVSTSEDETLLRCGVASHSTRVRVWTDHPSEPEKIFVALR